MPPSEVEKSVMLSGALVWITPPFESVPVWQGLLIQTRLRNVSIDVPDTPNGITPMAPAAERLNVVATTTAGAVVYPVPPFDTLTDEMEPPESVAVAVAPVPPPPLNVSVGVPVKPVPPDTTVTDATEPELRIATADAPVPLPPEKPMLGVDV